MRGGELSFKIYLISLKYSLAGENDYVLEKKATFSEELKGFFSYVLVIMPKRARRLDLIVGWLSSKEIRSFIFCTEVEISQKGAHKTIREFWKPRKRDKFSFLAKLFRGGLCYKCNARITSLRWEPHVERRRNIAIM